MPRFHLLHTNDLHSHLQMTHALYTKMTQLRHQWEECGEGMLLVDAGDHMDRSCLETEGTQGFVNRLLLEKFSYDAITLGNNELFTFSQEQLAELYQDTSFTVISSNVVDTHSKTRPSWCKRWKIFQRKGLTIGVLGVTVPFVHYYEQMGWQLDSPLAVLERDAHILRNQVDLLIVLSHVGLEFDRKLAQVVPSIDIIVGAHTHHLLEQGERIGNTLLVAAGKYGQNLGHVMVEWDEKKKLISKQAICLPMNSEESVPEVSKILAKAEQQANETLAKQVAILDKPLLVDWQEESPFSNLLADSLADWVGTGLALVNSGQILHSFTHTIIQEKDVHRVCPHPINPVLLSLRGNVIYQTLEQSLIPSFAEKKIRGYGFRGKQLGNLAVSGLEIWVEKNNPPFKRIQEIRFNGELLEKDEDYLVATIDMFTFGVGYEGLKNGKMLKVFMPEFIRDLLVRQLVDPNALKRCHQKRFYFL